MNTKNGTSRICKSARQCIAKQQLLALTLKQAADEAGVCHATMARFQKGGLVRSGSRRKIEQWIHSDARTATTQTADRPLIDKVADIVTDRVLARLGL